MEEENSKNPLDRVFGKRPKTQKRRSTDGANRGGGDRAAKAGSLPRTSGRSGGCEAEAARRGPHRTLSLPRRPLAEPGDQPEEKSLELSGRVPSRWRRGRVGDASGRRELPSRGGVAERRSFFFSCFFSSGEKFLGSEVARAGEPRCGRPSTAVAGGELLPRDVEGDAGSAEVSGIARAEILGDDRAFSEALRKPQPWLPAAGGEPCGGGGKPRTLRQAGLTLRKRARNIQPIVRGAGCL